MENEIVNRYKHELNPTMYFCLFVNMPHSDFKMKNSNKGVVSLLFLLCINCVIVSCTLTS